MSVRNPAPIVLILLAIVGATSLLPPCSVAATAIPGDHLRVDSVVADTVHVLASDSLKYVPAGEFTYADVRRATLYGDLPLERTHLDPLRATVVGAAYAGALVGLHLNMSKAWWNDRAGFRLKDDWDDVLQIDKAGHALSGYMMSYVLSEGMMAAGVSWESSTIAGSSLALLYQTYVELEDGFSESWGFSLTDMAANVVGAGLYLGQHYSPLLQNFTPKYQFVPAAWLDVPHLSTTWIDDYNSSTFWISANVHNLLPAAHRAWWPSWLNVALGYGVAIDDTSKRRRLIVALDYDLVKLLPDGGHVWNWFRQSLNYVKLPAPAVEFSDRVRFRLLFPFSIDIGSLRM